MATVTGTTPTRRTETRRLPRSTGALSGLLIILLGIWGGLIPFVGPYFHYAFGSYKSWHYTSARLWLDIVPGAVAVVGGLMLLRSSRRTSGLIGGWLAVAAGAWFAIGPTVALIWHHASHPIGAPMGGTTRQALELLGYFQALGVAIVGLAAFAMGRYFSRPRLVEEAAVAEDEAIAHEPVGAHEPIEEREAPAAAAAGGAVAAREAEPFGARDAEPLGARDAEPGGARDAEPVGAREGEHLGTREEPVAGENEPVPSADESARRIIEPRAPENEPPAEEPVAPGNEPATHAGDPATQAGDPAAQAGEPATQAGEPATQAGESGVVSEPGAANEGAAAAPESTTGPGAVTYRRRPGLARFGRR